MLLLRGLLDQFVGDLPVRLELARRADPCPWGFLLAPILVFARTAPIPRHHVSRVASRSAHFRDPRARFPPRGVSASSRVCASRLPMLRIAASEVRCAALGIDVFRSQL